MKAISLNIADYKTVTDCNRVIELILTDAYNYTGYDADTYTPLDCNKVMQTKLTDVAIRVIAALTRRRNRFATRFAWTRYSKEMVFGTLIDVRLASGIIG